jgi:hypothetical protein
MAIIESVGFVTVNVISDHTITTPSIKEKTESNLRKTGTKYTLYHQEIDSLKFSMRSPVRILSEEVKRWSLLYKLSTTSSTKKLVFKWLFHCV